MKSAVSRPLSGKKVLGFQRKSGSRRYRARPNGLVTSSQPSVTLGEFDATPSSRSLHPLHPLCAPLCAPLRAAVRAAVRRAVGGALGARSFFVGIGLCESPADARQQ